MFEEQKLLDMATSIINKEVQKALKESREFESLGEFEDFQEMIDCLFGYRCTDNLKDEVFELFELEEKLYSRVDGGNLIDR